MIERENVCRAYFQEDTSILINEMEFSSLEKAVKALQRNGFHQYSEDKSLQKFIKPPPLPFNRKVPVSATAVCLSGWYRA